MFIKFDNIETQETIRKELEKQNERKFESEFKITKPKKHKRNIDSQKKINDFSIGVKNLKNSINKTEIQMDLCVSVACLSCTVVGYSNKTIKCRKCNNFLQYLCSGCNLWDSTSNRKNHECETILSEKNISTNIPKKDVANKIHSLQKHNPSPKRRKLANQKLLKQNRFTIDFLMKKNFTKDSI